MLRAGFKCNLRVILAETRIKQTELCEITGLKPPAINAIVNGRTDPPVTTAILIAKHVGRPVGEIWEREQVDSI